MSAKHQLHEAKQIALAMPAEARTELAALLLSTLTAEDRTRALAMPVDPSNDGWAIRRAIAEGKRRDGDRGAKP